MTPFQIYKFGLAIKLHFTNDQYDVFESRGGIKNCTEESFYTKSGVGRYTALARQLSTAQEAVQYFVACNAYSANIFDPQDSDDANRRWQRNKEMMTQLVLDDIDTIGDVEASLQGSPCYLQKLVSGGKINIETCVVLNRRFMFAKEWKNNFVYSDLGRKIIKLDKFVKCNEEKVLGKLNEIKHEQVQEV